MTIFDALAREWLSLARSAEARAALARWGEAEPALRRFGSLVEVEDFTRHAHRPAADAVLLALVRHAATDPFAAQALLCMLLPGCRTLARRLWWVDQDPEEVAAATVAAAYARIRGYPVERRPRLVALNILMDTAKDVRRTWRGPVEPAAHPEFLGEPLRPGPSPSDEVLALLREAVRNGFLDDGQARLVADVRLHGLSIEEIAAATGRHPGSLRRDRRAAERRLAGRAA